MIHAILALSLAATEGLGAPYPNATIDGQIDHARCSTRYALSTPDPIDEVALFYKAEAAAANVGLLDDSAAKFRDYRTLAFNSRPKFMFVLMSREGSKTTVRVAYHTTIPPGCA